MRTLDTEAKVDPVCRHHAEFWNAVSADLNTLLTGNFSGLAHVLGEVETTHTEVETTHTDLMKATEPFFTALYRQPIGTPMEDAHFTLFTKKKKTGFTSNICKPLTARLPSLSAGYAMEGSRP